MRILVGIIHFFFFAVFCMFTSPLYACRWEAKSCASCEQTADPVEPTQVFYAGWGYPRSIEVCNYDPDCMPWVSGNGKRLFFVSTNVIGPPRPGHMGDWDIYMAEWDSINQCWGEEVNAGPNINTPGPERRPSSSYNGDTLYFGRMGDILRSTWDGTQWTPVVIVPLPDYTLYGEDNPAISLDGRRLYFDCPNRPGGMGGSDIWVARWNGTSWDSVTNLGIPVNTPFTETRPFESADRQRLYFSNFGGPPRLEGSYGETDIYVSEWTGSGWGAVSVVAAPINNDRVACTPYESPDGQELWIASESWEGSRGDEDIWVARKGILFPPDTAQGYGNWVKTGELENTIYVYDLKEGANDIIYAATACADTAPMGKVFKTTDGGITWMATADLPEAMVVYSLLVCGDTIYAGTYPNGDIFKSVNGGNSWTNTANIPGITSSRALLRLQNGNILVGTAPESLGYSRVYRTTDGGLSWTRTALLREIDSPFAFLYQTSTGTIFAGGWSTGPIIYKSTNNGVTWDTVRLLVTNERASVDGFYETNDGTYYAMGWIHTGTGVRGGYVYKSVDSGTTWDTTAKIVRGEVLSVRIYTMAEDLFGTIYAGFQPAYDSVVYASSDGGATWYWTGSLSGAFECLTLLKASDGYVYAGTTPNGDVFKYVPTDIEENTTHYTFNAISLFQIEPNPFRTKTVIKFKIQNPKSTAKGGSASGRETNSKCQLSLRIYDVSGRLIRQWDDKTFRLSEQITWDGTDDSGHEVQSGVYFYKFETGELIKVGKCVLIK